MWVARDATGASYPSIGEAMGGMHHTSVLHGVRRVEATPRLLAQARDILGRVGAERTAA
jgi:chromosomal replication initiation ATPase DnaA